MGAQPVAILGTGLVTAVGMSTVSSCCAFRTKATNPSETGFIDSCGDRVLAHAVDLDRPRPALAKLARMASLAIAEALQDLDRSHWPRLAMLLCAAEPERPGRQDGLDERLLPLLQDELGVVFGKGSALVARGRVGVAVALARARQLLPSAERGVLIVGVDSLLSRPALSHFDREDRLLTADNSNGFMPGEAAGALWVGHAAGLEAPFLCTGIGFGVEPAPIGSGEPLRAEGLTQAIKASLGEAGRQMHEMAFRITDLSGEHFYFKEAALALARTMREPAESFDLWHPAECTGEVGAASGATVIAAAMEACRKGYAPGPRMLAHWSGDSGQRAAVTLEFAGSAP